MGRARFSSAELAYTMAMMALARGGEPLRKRLRLAMAAVSGLASDALPPELVPRFAELLALAPAIPSEDYGATLAALFEYIRRDKLGAMARLIVAMACELSPERYGNPAGKAEAAAPAGPRPRDGKPDRPAGAQGAAGGRSRPRSVDGDKHAPPPGAL